MDKSLLSGRISCGSDINGMMCAGIVSVVKKCKHEVLWSYVRDHGGDACFGGKYFLKLKLN